MKKQLITLIAMLLPMLASADAVEIDGICYNLNTETKTAEVTKNPNNYSGSVIIPESVKQEETEYCVISIGGCAFQFCSGLNSISIPESMTYIGNSAFEACYGLTSVTIPSSVTTIDYCAFQNCTGLTSLIIPGSVTTIGGAAFMGCSGLTSVSILDGVTTIGGSAFYGCIGLTSVTIPNSVTTIDGSAFQYCSGLASITIGNGIKTISSGAFASCPDLTDVYCYAENVPSSHTYAFKDSHIENATLHVPAGSVEAYKTAEPWKNFKNIVEMGDDNDDSDKIVEATCAEVIAGKDGTVYRVTGRVASIVNTNYGNWYLEDETGQIYIYGTHDKNGKYPKNSSWESFGINEGDVITVQGPKSTYNGTAELVDVRVLNPLTLLSDNLIYLHYDACDVAINLYCSGEPCEVTVSDEATSWLTVKSITEGPDVVVTLHAEENKSLTRYATVTFKNTVDGKEYTEQVNIYQTPYMFTSKTKEGVEMMFRVSADGEEKSCVVAGIGEDPQGYYPAIDTQTAGHITIPGEVNGYAVTSIDFYAFKDCQELTGITIPEGLITINSYAFEGCTRLSEIDFPSYVLDFGLNVFDDTPWFTNQPDGLIYIKNLLYTYKGEMPENTEIKVPDGCTSISYGAFTSQLNLASIELPAGLTRIGSLAFCYSGIKQITIPTSCAYVYTRGFKGCENLEEVSLLGDTYLAAGVFSVCPNLKKITVYSPEPANINPNAFYYRIEDKNDDSIYERATLYVPVGSKALYEDAEGWKNFKNIVEMGLDPVEESEIVDFGEDGDITENTDLTGTIVNNMYYNIGTDAGGYNSEEGCIVITKDTSEEQMMALEGLGITDEELKQNFTGIIFKVPAGSGKVAVTAETKGNMTLKVKVGNGEPMEMELTGKLKMKVPYSVSEESLVYIYAGTTDGSAARGLMKSPEESSLKIYGIEWEQTSLKGDANGDGEVNVADIDFVIESIGADVETNKAADVNDDGEINVADVDYIIERIN